MDNLENIMAAVVYTLAYCGGLLGGCLTALHAWRLWRADGLTRAVRVVIGVSLLAWGSGLIAAWFTVSRVLGRPEWMFESLWPLVFRCVEVSGLMMILALYTPARFAPAVIVILAVASVGLAIIY